MIGTIRIVPTTSGTPILKRRCFTTSRTPRLFHIIAVKNPLTIKKSGIREACTRSTITPKLAGSARTSCAHQPE